ncbi:MAG: SRPBCC family protein [Verrucomicrobiales bacterium]|nr:SRPBCC family protein [Verrucomicrobiales bacterium]
MKIFRKTVQINVSAEKLEAWHYEKGAFERLCPPWEKMKVIEAPAEIADGTRVVIATKTGPLWLKWVAEHRDCRPGESFADIQISGPFANWIHLHRFHSLGENCCELEDLITYRLPFGFIGDWFGSAFVKRKLQRVFEYRHRVTKESLESVEV